ncbi:hypothetical protein A4H97_12555 [Niastella yeongjuensis]|uniref:DUF1275 family protein n=1 Tax=Niastella yeongjuensis TaxID=354355 RepID=A0A1V9EAL3_9BACT|nr:YoaK family protein [Niastella yeongjuensis]OQP42975.1 hypothetical protein A4H97_12555 [Niastella yeongjuensis]SEO61549.1 Uncharacterized membrane protein YoaK, UPF0700 family [Niastella yeongjuensis]
MSRINWVTFLLAWVAGFCDTATFIAGDSIFSAHVTGNFIVFAAQVVSDSHTVESWVKVLTFPVFVMAVMTGGWLAERSPGKYKLLFIEGLVLTISGIMALVSPLLKTIDQNLLSYVIVMIAVFGMGLQNAFGKLFAKETHGPTTMMTGNVTQASLDLGRLIWNWGTGDGTVWSSFKKQLVVIGGFLAGCLLGAVLAKWIGLSAIVIPGLATVVCYVVKRNPNA